MKEQLEKLIGASILDIGSSGCVEEETCKGRGCWSKVEIQNTFSTIDANETSLVGPELKLITGCGCQPSSDTQALWNGTTTRGEPQTVVNIGRDLSESTLVYATSINQAIPKTDTLLTNAEHRGHLLSYGDQYECVYNPCLNGGKCLPTSSGFR